MTGKDAPGPGSPAPGNSPRNPVLAADMIDRALDAGIPARWATGDAVYGQHTGLRRRLEAGGCTTCWPFP
ncbi:hypothetical protein [Arthrobacter sp. H16F315]|uniref:hypothetical protein n=1 Tax=Arthrobacter sp. H16F315 TaxID=2955314 RepID=UPI00406C653C